MILTAVAIGAVMLSVDRDGGSEEVRSEAAMDVKRELLFSTCGSSSHLFASSAGYSAATLLACAQLPSEGFGGYAFIEPGSPPDECALAHPVIILSSAPLADRVEWERHQGCSDATTTGDSEGNLITTYGSCDNTLTTSIPSPPIRWRRSSTAFRQPSSSHG